jgi:lysine N6-hydroxylase
MSHHKPIYDIIGIGIGPFNLGMAALTDSIPELNCLFIEQNKEFNWHPGMMLDNARLQVPFYADLVTLADPCSRYSFLAFLKAKQRMFRFAILENNFITRKEYNEYCRWVAGQLACLQFGFRCEAIRYDDTDKIYAVYVRDVSTQMGYVHYCKKLVMGVGSVPYVPECAKSLAVARDDKGPLVFHSSDYLNFKELLLTKKAVAIIGSGQSAAEIFYDLLTAPPTPLLWRGEMELKWFTRNDSFYPMDYSRFTLEKTSPDYIEHFYSLDPETKKRLLPFQDKYYKGINSSLIDDIYNQLYQLSLSSTSPHIALHSNCELKELIRSSEAGISLVFYHSQPWQSFTTDAEAVTLATGYQNKVPEFIQPVKERIQWNLNGSYQVNRNYSIDESNTIFIQNAELHTHGFSAPDLGMGPYRNAIILNSILGYERFQMENGVAFQKFGIPDRRHL